MKNRIWQKLALIFFDEIVIIIAFCGAYFFRLETFYHTKFPFEPYIKMVFLMIPVWIFFLAIGGRYTLSEKSLWQEFSIIFLSSLAASLFFPLAFFFQNELFFSRGILFLLFLFSSSLLFSVTFLEIWWKKWEVQRNRNISRLLVIGANRSAERVIKDLLDHFSRKKPVAILAPYGTRKKEIEGVKIMGKLDALERICKEENITEIFLCEGIEHSANILSFCQNTGISFLSSLETMGIVAENIRGEKIGNTDFLFFQNSPLFGWGQFFKRLFDIIFACLGIIIFSPYIFAKFLTLKKIPYKNGKDSSFFRFVFSHSSFGEKIGGLFNVLQGEMSIVGPLAIDQQTYNEVFSQRLFSRTGRRFLLRPGIFAPVQKEAILSYPEESLEKEIIYIQKWSFWKDFVLIFSSFTIS